jgi:hypothetical protein
MHININYIKNSLHLCPKIAKSSISTTEVPFNMNKQELKRGISPETSLPDMLIKMTECYLFFYSYIVFLEYVTI